MFETSHQAVETATEKNHIHFIIIMYYAIVFRKYHKEILSITISYHKSGLRVESSVKSSDESSEAALDGKKSVTRRLKGRLQGQGREVERDRHFEVIL